jgi:arginyl-tRNA--protein-N-Asp/Glu arginylyltransferase
MTEAYAFGLRFYASHTQRCSYLPERESVSAFADPREAMSTHLYGMLAVHGFRRSGEYVYRPHCPSCQACIPARIPVARFRGNRNQRRNLRRNRDLTIVRRDDGFRREHFDLYHRYLDARHPEGEMANPTPEDYRRFLTSGWSDTHFVEFRLDNHLVAVTVIDRLPQGLSAVYTFFSPEHATRSLGRYAILWQIQEAMRLKLPYVYLGYWIEGCRKMDYKLEFQPLEGLIGGEWRELRSARRESGPQSAWP